MTLIPCLLALTTALTAADLKRYSRAEIHMGVEFEVMLYAADPDLAATALNKAFARIAALNKVLSDYDLDSELSRLSATSANRNAESADHPSVAVSGDLWAVLAEAQEVSRASDGAFDVTLGPVTRLWRRARRWKELPEPAALAAARASVGYQALQLDAQSHTVRLLKPNMRLDLGGIAKGYAADEAVKTVVAGGIPIVLVRASGDIAAADPPPGQRGWRVGIAPLDADAQPQRFVELAQGGISTSGDARQHLIVAGRRYSHIIDPRTGQGVNGRSSVTVIGPRGMLADALATAASVLGPDRSLPLVSKFAGVELLMVYEDDTGQQRVVESAGFKRFE